MKLLFQDYCFTFSLLQTCCITKTIRNKTQHGILRRIKCILYQMGRLYTFSTLINYPCTRLISTSLLYFCTHQISKQTTRIYQHFTSLTVHNDVISLSGRQKSVLRKTNVMAKLISHSSKWLSGGPVGHIWTERDLWSCPDSNFLGTSSSNRSCPKCIHVGMKIIYVSEN